MIGMPYILVDIVFSVVSLALFCVTSAALLSRCSWADSWLPARLRDRRALAFVARGLVLAVLSMAAVQAISRIAGIPTTSPRLTDPFYAIGVLNSMVLAYRYMDKRCFLGTPKLRRRLLIATVSVVLTLVLAVALVVALIALFVIR